MVVRVSWGCFVNMFANTNKSEPDQVGPKLEKMFLPLWNDLIVNC